MTTTLANGTVTITYTTDPTKLVRILTAAAEYLYSIYPLSDAEGGMIPFAELTNAQKLAVIDQHVKRVIMDAAQTQAVSAAIVLARATAQEEDLTI